MNTMKRISALAVLTLVGITAPASAQWSVTNLHFEGMNGSSFAHGVHGGQQVGSVGIWSDIRAAYWNGSSDSWVQLDLGPETSFAYGVHAGTQVGWQGSFMIPRATLWNGTSDSAVSLHPSSAARSVARAVHNGQQVGYTVDPFNGVPEPIYRASLWSGTAESWIDLGGPGSLAYGVHAGQQVGMVPGSNGSRATLWFGTAESQVDLHPFDDDATSDYESSATAVHDGQQCGWTMIFGKSHASVWNGSADSWVNLGPDGAQSSTALAVHAGMQVGWAEFHGGKRASLWSSSAESWEDLSLALTGSWSYTEATGIWSDGSFIYISGFGFNLDTGRQEALLWTRAVPAPSSVALLALGGLIAAGRRR